MDIIFKDVTITCVRCATDTLLITPKNVSMGIWPFEGNHLFKTELPRGHTEEWLTENFGEDILECLKIIDSEK